MVRTRQALVLFAAAVFAATFLARALWLSQTYFHPDESTVLWMALDAVRHPTLPDHGLVSHYQAFQPPGLVWITAPFVALGGGRPDFVIVGFALLNAGAIAFLALTVARSWSIVQAVVMSAFLVVGPDARMSTWIWHPSLYTGAISLLIGAGIRLRSGSRWWATVLVAIPGLYALIHYSGFVLFGPTLALLLLSRRRWPELAAPVGIGLALVLVAWVPFLLFEHRRGWTDFSTIAHSSDTRRTLLGKVSERASAGLYAVIHLGWGIYSRVHLTPFILAGTIGAFALALRRRSTDAAVIVPTLVLATGVAAQVATNQGRRTDVLLLWLPALYALCGWTVAQLCGIAAGRVRAVPARTVTVAITAGAVIVVLAVGGIDLRRAITGTATEQTLGYQLAAAKTHAPVHYKLTFGDSLYLPCDPPYDWGSQTWYLEEVDHPGTGIQAAVRAGAFSTRHGTCKSRH